MLTHQCRVHLCHHHPVHVRGRAPQGSRCYRVGLPILYHHRFAAGQLRCLCHPGQDRHRFLPNSHCHPVPLGVSCHPLRILWAFSGFLRWSLSFSGTIKLCSAADLQYHPRNRSLPPPRIPSMVRSEGTRRRCFARSCSGPWSTCRLDLHPRGTRGDCRQLRVRVRAHAPRQLLCPVGCMLLRQCLRLTIQLAKGHPGYFDSGEFLRVLDMTAGVLTNRR